MIVAVGLSHTLPLAGGLMVIGLEIDDDSVLSGDDVTTERRPSLWVLDQPRSLFLDDVETDYFETFGIPLLSGRDFTERDDRGAPAVAIVNETLARRIARDGNPIGRRLIEPNPQGKPVYCEVIGVVKDISSAAVHDRRADMGGS